MKTHQLSDLSTLTSYQILSIAKKHLLKQGERSTNGRINGACKYRTVNEKTGKPLMCGIGIFISDAEYLPVMEGMKARDLISKLAPDVDKTLSMRTIATINTIQNIHDFVPIEKWATEFAHARKQLRNYKP